VSGGPLPLPGWVWLLLFAATLGWAFLAWLWWA
jgi:hypothetical protein